jgi:hypothetical protein
VEVGHIAASLGVFVGIVVVARRPGADAPLPALERSAAKGASFVALTRRGAMLAAFLGWLVAGCAVPAPTAVVTPVPASATPAATGLAAWFASREQVAWKGTPSVALEECPRAWLGNAQPVASTPASGVRAAVYASPGAYDFRPFVVCLRGGDGDALSAEAGAKITHQRSLEASLPLNTAAGSALAGWETLSVDDWPFTETAPTPIDSIRVTLKSGTVVEASIGGSVVDMLHDGVAGHEPRFWLATWPGLEISISVSAFGPDGTLITTADVNQEP